MKLREIAHSRTGDKGNTSNISVIAFDERRLPVSWSGRHRRARAGALRRASLTGEVTRYELPKLGALNFVLRDALGRRRHALARARRTRQGPEFGHPGSRASG